MKSKAFTLAEILITLGIIGVVAALTLPVLIEEHQKKETVAKLKALNSIMGQAFQLSKTENGDWSTWDNNSFGNGGPGYDWTSGDGNEQLKWLEKYVLPYLKITETSVKGKYAIVGLANGSGFSNYNGIYFFCLKFSDCKKNNRNVEFKRPVYI